VCPATLRGQFSDLGESGDQFNASKITTGEWSGAFLRLSSQRVLLGLVTSASSAVDRVGRDAEAGPGLVLGAA
jgi:hypothetical protein